MRASLFARVARAPAASARGFAARPAVVLTTDHFAALGLPRTFEVDPSALRADYLRLMAEHHPDRHTLASDADQADSADRSAALTRAFSVVSAPHRRAVHLLELLGAPLMEETNGTALLGREFLSEVMDARFDVEDSDTTVERLKELRVENSQAMEAMHAELRAAFARVAASGRGSEDGTAALEAAKELTAKLGYLKKIDDVADDRLELEEERGG